MTAMYDLLAAHAFLAGLPPPDLERLSRWACRVPFGAGARVFEENGPADRFWLIQEGSVNLDIRVPGRGDLIVETLGPGAVLGWSWRFPPYRWRFGAVAVEPVLSIAVDGPATRALCDADPAFGYELTKRLMAVVVDRMQATRMRLLDLYSVPT
ncbi:cyclic nucleotide-binding domain-containing protein [Dactylosporangium aurantiacum]|uniref:Cyclic nucleotide-binding domain-containing protein n=1 Tax=Dactylosporangium aurantiacum TaxID=35754 RepID=A0A9Q9MCP6_9ACTN|nr:cyclic nucleotide-binding domain-containing protein [Dactylosporangium aurantiacum]MDG6107298.1 cyclic nucleotide-binding domain-containing protein [Dactylosporangium aurantiacum]UWZ51174.1 cyclic nucleotide-binding domain-containing protein [Dactylosporangium aurantiacum]